jgi:hypothetical protein
MTMSKPRVVAFAVSIVFLFSLVSAVSADPVHIAPGLQKLNLGDGVTFDLPDMSRDELHGLLAEHFQDNNGRHLGFFSVASFHGGMKFGLVDPRTPLTTEATPNPEPTGMLLLGTGLAGTAAFLRRRARRRKEEN